jgi:hypothetical protein
MAQISGSFNKWTDDIRPINLTTTNLVNNTTCIVSGWGTTLDVRQLFYLFHPVSNFNTLRHQFESGKTQKTAGRRLSVAIGNTKVTIGITIIQV